MIDILSVNEDHCLDSLSSSSTSGVASQVIFLQIGLEVAITLISQVDEVIAPVDAPGNTLMFAQVTVNMNFDLYSTSAVHVGSVERNFSDDFVIQLVDDGELTDTDDVLLTWLLDFAAEPTLYGSQ
jgi:hypothetical protein